MRKVKIKANKYINQGREKEGEAFFHCFGVLYEEIGETAGNFTVARSLKIVKERFGTYIRKIFNSWIHRMKNTFKYQKKKT